MRTNKQTTQPSYWSEVTQKVSKNFVFLKLIFQYILKQNNEKMELDVLQNKLN